MDNNTNTEETVEKEEVENLEIDNNYEYDDEEVDTSQETSRSTTNNNDDEFREKIIKMFKIVLIALIIILILGFIISLVTKKKYTYSSVEDVMKNAAISYFKDNNSKLPKENEIVEVTTDILVSNKYMKSLNHYIKGENCSGKVSVEKVANSKLYNYTPILSCGDYTTTSLADKVKEAKNIVEEGYGVYYLNGEYVYRGLDVNNYVKFNDSDNLWRIVKINSDNEAVLISQKRTKNVLPWDDRYNGSVDDTSGISVYHNSTISSLLNKLFDDSLSKENEYYNDEHSLLTESERSKVVEFDACVGQRSENETSKDGSVECSVTEKAKMSLLPVYDFMNASIDNNCSSTIKPDCQNYNYLRSEYGYWLANGDSENSDKVYSASTYIYKKKASNESPVRVVVHLNSNVMVESGKGTEKEPFVIR